MHSHSPLKRTVDWAAARVEERARTRAEVAKKRMLGGGLGLKDCFECVGREEGSTQHVGMIRRMIKRRGGEAGLDTVHLSAGCRDFRGLCLASQGSKKGNTPALLSKAACRLSILEVSYPNVTGLQARTNRVPSNGSAHTPAALLFVLPQPQHGVRSPHGTRHFKMAMASLHEELKVRE